MRHLPSVLIESTLRAAAVAAAVAAFSALAPQAAQAEDAPPECVEIYVLPDDATLPYVVACRP